MGAFVLGYHGCDRDVGESLLSGKTQFKASENAHDWLGHGIYFWENNPMRAMDWAQFMAAHSRFKHRVHTPYAVGAVIDLGNCLDLTESSSLILVEEAFHSLKKLFELSDLTLPENKAASKEDEDLVERFLDCAVINHVHELCEDYSEELFDTVRGAFHEGRPLYPGAAIMQKTHIQLCVRNSSRVRGIFRVPELQKEKGGKRRI